MSVLIIAEHNHQTLKPATFTVVTAAQQLKEEVVLWVIGYGCQAVAEQASKIQGVQRVIVTDAPAYRYFLAENVAALIQTTATHYHYILAASSTFGKNILPRVAALCDVAMLSDVIKIIDQETFVRPTYAGNVWETVRTSDPLKIMTIRPTAFDKAIMTEETVDIASYQEICVDQRVQFVSLEQASSERPDLTTARVIVSGGRGLQSKEQFQTIVRIADRLNAAIGASRAAVDSEFVSNDYQIGQTGKIVAPELYIAVGISGAIQHLAGMVDSRIIVAINKDAEAPIFNVADYGLVGDWFTILPELEAALTKHHL